MPIPLGSPVAEAEAAYRRERIMADFRPRSRGSRRLRLPVQAAVARQLAPGRVTARAPAGLIGRLRRFGMIGWCRPTPSLP